MPAKSSSRNNNKRLTDFFVQTSSASMPTLPTSISSVGMSVTRRSATRASKTAIDYQSPMNSSVPSQTCNAATMTTRKRAHSPDNINPSTSSNPPMKLKSTRKRSLPERPQTVIYVTSPLSSHSSLAQLPTPVRVQSSTLMTPPLDSSERVVYSSQSDEAELALPTIEPRNLENVVEGVDTWRRKTFESSNSSPPRVPEHAMEVDPPSPTRSSPLAHSRNRSPFFDAAVRSAATSRSNTATQTPDIVSACLPSPPDTNELHPFPLTPEPIDSEAKTAKIIADIKARAFAAGQSHKNEVPLSFHELEDSDDSELDDELPLIGGKNKRSTLASQTRGDMFSSPLSSVPSTFGDPSANLRTHRTVRLGSSPSRPRTSARTRNSALVFRLPMTIAESSSSASVTKSRLPARKKSQSANPVQALLREKALQEKRGTSSTALRLAEEAARQGSCELPANSDSELDTMDQSCFTDEQAAWKAVHESRMFSSPVDPDNAEVTFGDRESKMLGTVAGEAINRLLANDKDSNGKEKVQDLKMTQGFLLWIRPSDEDMDVDSTPISPLSGHPILICLGDLLERDDDSVLDLVLRTGVLAAVPRDVLLSNMPQIISMALFASSQVANATCVALRDLWGSNTRTIQMPFAAILFALVQLGANPSTLEGLGYVKERTRKNHLDRETLLKALKKFLIIIKTAGCAGAFTSGDIANVVLSLVVIGLDPLTSGELTTQLNVTIDVVCNYCVPDDLIHDVREKILRFTRQLAPINKAQSISFLASGSGQTRRIARSVAYCLLVSVPTIPVYQAPPLEPLILLVSPDSASRELFDVASGLTDYEDLEHYVNILAVALFDIGPYVEEERATMKSGGSVSVQGSPSKSRRLPMPPLEVLRRALEVLHSKIVDTRAANLDRSRTKGALHCLMMRINYDRMALKNSRPSRQASTLKAYFSPQRT